MISDSATETNAQISSPSSIDRNLLKFVRYYWPIAVVCVALGWIAAGIYFVKTPPVYETQAEVLLMPKDPALATRGVDGSNDVNATLSMDLMATYIMLIKSPAIVQKALENHNLDKLPSLASESGTGASAAEVVIDGMTVTRGGRSRSENAQVLSVSFQHKNAEDAKLIVDAVIEEFRQFIDKKFADRNKTAAELIAKAQQQLKSDLETTEREFREFSSEAPILIGTENSTNIYRAEFEQIEAELTDLRMARTEKISRLKLVEEQLRLIKESGGTAFDKLALIGDESAERIKVFLEVLAGRQDSLLFMAQQPERAEVARGEYEELLKLKSRLKSLVEDFGPEHSEVRNVRGQIETVENFLESRADKLKVEDKQEDFSADKIVEAYISLLKNDLRAYDSREALLVESSRSAEAKAKELIELELKGSSLKLAVDRQKELFDATVERLHDINLAKDYGGFISETIRFPAAGVEIWPKLPPIFAGGTAAGLFLAVAISVVLELRNRSLRSVEDVEKAAGVSVISAIPKFTEHLEPETQQAIKDSKSLVAPTVITFHCPGSREAEIFRGLRTSLLFRLTSSKSKVIAITSPSAGDGKSTVLLNLAVSLAHAGRRVLLIDADMRRPTVAKNLGVNSATGLSEVLLGTATFADSVKSSPKDKLDILVAGRTPEHPAELLSSEKFQELIESVKAEYDIVLLDCPPVLAVADPCVISSQVDGLLLVVRTNSRSKFELKRTISLINEVEANLLGIVVNASKLEMADGENSDQLVGYGYGTHGARASQYFRNNGNGTNAESNGRRESVESSRSNS